VANEVADKLNVDYHIISSSFKISDEDYTMLTDGLIDVGLQSRISYFYALRKVAGNEVMAYTGDGGDKTLSALGFRYSIADEKSLLQYIMETDQIFRLTEICSILNLDKDVFTKHLESHLMRYPEVTMEGKFAHFRIFERGFKWLFVGEDRNRLFMWSTTPFYDLSFFRASMEVSQSGKDYYRLYKEFLSILNPVLPRIKYHDRLVPLSIPNSLLRLFLFVFDWLKAHFYKRGTVNFFDLFLGQQVDQMPKLTKDFLLHILSLETLDFFDPSTTRRVVVEEKNQSKLNVLATLILYSNSVRFSRSS
jgi:asparagine synthase (glutamine-hydrolysing)